MPVISIETSEETEAKQAKSERDAELLRAVELDV